VTAPKVRVLMFGLPPKSARFLGLMRDDRDDTVAVVAFDEDDHETINLTAVHPSRVVADSEPHQVSQGGTPIDAEYWARRNARKRR
jgi:hypothetical protein